MFQYTDREFLIAEMKRLNEIYNKRVKEYQENNTYANWLRIEQAQEEFNKTFTRFTVLEDSDNVSV